MCCIHFMQCVYCIYVCTKFVVVVVVICTVVVVEFLTLLSLCIGIGAKVKG